MTVATIESIASMWTQTTWGLGCSVTAALLPGVGLIQTIWVANYLAPTSASALTISCCIISSLFLDSGKQVASPKLSGSAAIIQSESRLSTNVLERFHPQDLLRHLHNKKGKVALLGTVCGILLLLTLKDIKAIPILGIFTGMYLFLKTVYLEKLKPSNNWRATTAKCIVFLCFIGIWFNLAVFSKATYPIHIIITGYFILPHLIDRLRQYSEHPVQIKRRLETSSVEGLLLLLSNLITMQIPGISAAELLAIDAEDDRSDQGHVNHFLTIACTDCFTEYMSLPLLLHGAASGKSILGVEIPFLDWPSILTCGLIVGLTAWRLTPLVGKAFIYLNETIPMVITHLGLITVVSVTIAMNGAISLPLLFIGLFLYGFKTSNQLPHRISGLIFLMPMVM